MTTTRRYKTYWTEVKRIVAGEVKVTTCCCAGPGLTPQQCRDLSGNKNPCRCDCHRKTAK